MSQSISCDHCGTTVAAAPSSTFEWFHVAMGHDCMQDACSAPCAHALVDAAQQLTDEIAAEVATETAGSAR